MIVWVTLYSPWVSLEFECILQRFSWSSLQSLLPFIVSKHHSRQDLFRSCCVRCCFWHRKTIWLSLYVALFPEEMTMNILQVHSLHIIYTASIAMLDVCGDCHSSSVVLPLASGVDWEENCDSLWFYLDFEVWWINFTIMRYWLTHALNYTFLFGMYIELVLDHRDDVVID